MKKLRGCSPLLALLLTSATLFFSLSTPARAQDDGARAYWKGRAGTHVVSFQYLPMFLDAEGSKAFAPGQYIYPNSKIDAHIVMASYGYHFTLPWVKRPSVFAVNVVGGSVGLDADVSTLPPGFEPPLPVGTTAFSQSSTGFGDPSTQLTVNLFGTPPLKSNVDLLNYEPTWTADFAGMLAIPIGAYEGSKLVNIGLNRWYGRLALPIKYHFRVFAPGRMSSFEVMPSVWLFGENDDFLGKKLENDPLWSVEAHLTHDFTPTFYGSLDLLYQNGFQSQLDGTDAGEKLEIGSIGFTLHYQVSSNAGIRTGFSSNVFGDDNLKTAALRSQFVYAWNAASENAKRLEHGH
jgi:hypothetical protein